MLQANLPMACEMMHLHQHLIFVKNTSFKIQSCSLLSNLLSLNETLLMI